MNAARPGGASGQRRAPRSALVVVAAVLLLGGLSSEAVACPSCTAEFRAALSSFGWGKPVLGFGLVGAACVLAVVLAQKPLARSLDGRALLRAGLLLGIGMGGFVDGIVLHQILQWHGTLSGALTPADLVSAKVNMFWDGVFHAVVWLFTACGLWGLWAAARRGTLGGQGPRFVAALFLGWAVFNVAEGVVDHQLLGLHHVRDFVAWRAPWDWSLLGLSALMGAISGAWLWRSRHADTVYGSDAERGSPIGLANKERLP